MNGAPLREHLLYTKDGGLTWKDTKLFAEFYQPVGISGTATFFVLSEWGWNTGQLARSDDGGETWRFLGKYTSPNTVAPVSGTIQCGTDMRLFFQTTPDAGDGIMMSEDTGYTFFSICGPTNNQDTRFYVRDTFIYAGDRYGGLWLNTTGIGSNSKPILSTDTIVFRPQTCSGEERIINFTLFDSCNNRQAKLLSASITGNPVFSFTKGAQQRTIHPEDSLVIAYTPDNSSKGNDSGLVHLQFKLGWKTFDTTIALLGIGNIVPDSVDFITSLTQNNILSSEVTQYLITPSKAVSGKNLSEIAFDVTLDEDLLEIQNINVPNGLSMNWTQTPGPNGVVTQHITLTGTDITLDPAVPIISFDLLTYITDTISTPIALSNIKLNGFDPDYERCTLSATSQDTTFTLALLCGDRTIVDFMRHGKSALEITSIKPNPAQDEIRVNFTALGNEPVFIDVLNALGQRVGRYEGSNQSAVLSVKDYMSGLYLITVRQGSESASAQFVVSK